MLDLIVEFFPWDWILWTMQEKMKFVFNHTRVTNRTESIVVGSLIIPFHIHVTYCGTSVRSVVEKTKSSKKERRLTVWTHAKLLQRNWNANCNTSDQGVISHSRAIKKKTNFCILMKLKATISIIVRVIEKIMFMMNSMANFFLAALLFMRLLRMFFKLQSDFTDAGRRQIHYLKKKRSPFILPWQRYFIEEGNFQNTRSSWIFF